MIRRGLVVIAGLVLVGSAAQAQTLIPGGGSKKTDCFAEWQANTAPPKGTTIKCTDGTACDADGVADGACTFTVGICIQQTNVPGCTPLPITSGPTVTGASIVPPSDLTTAGCGDGTIVTVPLIEKKGKCKKSKPTKLTMVTVAGRSDKDKLKLICLPAAGSTCGSVTTTTLPPCPANPAGGPSELKLTTVPGGLGGDLDNGFNGGSHNFPLVDTSALNFCLTDCGGADTSCTGTGAVGPGTKNTGTWGGPLPLIAATPVCVVNRFDLTKGIKVSEADYATGAITADVPLLADVYITTPSEVCPQCSGNGPVGSRGTCKGGKNNTKPCTVHGLVRVSGAPSNDKDFEMSADCPPTGAPVATLTINLNPFTTSTASLTGSPPCQRQVRDDACTAGGTCTRDCSATPVSRGGYQQFCCSNPPFLSCFPTAPGTLGRIDRVGSGTVPTPQGMFPATSSVVLASVFCEGATGNSAIDNIAAGLPGPGALLQPMNAEWMQATP